MVKILQRQLSTDRLRKEVHVKPSSHNTSEINHNRSVQLWLNRLRKQHIHDTVALKLLWRDPHLRKPHHCGRPPRCFPTRVKSFTPEVQRLPTVGITAEARRSLPCAVGDKKGVRMSVHLSTHHHLCYCWHIIYPSPPLPQPEVNDILSRSKIATYIVCYRQRVLIELRHRRLQHIVAHFIAIDVKVMVANGIDHGIHARCRTRQGKVLVQHRCLGKATVGHATNVLCLGCHTRYHHHQQYKYPS